MSRHLENLALRCFATYKVGSLQAALTGRSPDRLGTDPPKPPYHSGSLALVPARGWARRPPRNCQLSPAVRPPGSSFSPPPLRLRTAHPSASLVSTPCLQSRLRSGSSHDSSLRLLGGPGDLRGRYVLPLRAAMTSPSPPPPAMPPARRHNERKHGEPAANTRIQQPP